MSNQQGTFVWYDLMTDNTDAAFAYYSGLFGWGSEAMDMGPGGTYNILKNGENQFGGLAAKQMAQAPNAWTAYIGVDQVDSSLAKIQQMGGNVIVPGTDIPNIGRFAVVTDPQGAAFAIWQNQHGDSSAEPKAKTAGDFEWAELGTTDVEGAKGFYGENFNWKLAHAMDMPDGSQYNMMALGEQPIAGIMPKPDMAPAAYWCHYVQVENVDDTLAKSSELGGNTLHGPVTIPGMVQFAILSDPTGAMFGVAKSLKTDG